MFHEEAREKRIEHVQNDRGNGARLRSGIRFVIACELHAPYIKSSS